APRFQILAADAAPDAARGSLLGWSDPASPRPAPRAGCLWAIADRRGAKLRTESSIAPGDHERVDRQLSRVGVCSQLEPFFEEGLQHQPDLLGRRAGFGLRDDL